MEVLTLSLIIDMDVFWSVCYVQILMLPYGMQSVHLFSFYVVAT